MNPVTHVTTSIVHVVVDKPLDGLSALVGPQARAKRALNLKDYRFSRKELRATRVEQRKEAIRARQEARAARATEAAVAA